MAIMISCHHHSFSLSKTTQKFVGHTSRSSSIKLRSPAHQFKPLCSSQKSNSFQSISDHMAKIEVISSCLVGSTPNATSISTLELTTWDLRLLQYHAIQRGLLFHQPHESSQNFIHHLQHTFSLALHLFPPLAGRLATTAHDGDMVGFFVDCNNAGAEFTHAVAASVSVSDILDPKYTPEIVYSFFPLHEALVNLHGLSNPLLGVQVTELADGIFIGCTANHAVVDGTSFWHFINSWSQISRGCAPKPPVFDRWFPRNVGDDNNNRVVHLPTLKRNLLSPSSSPPPQRVFHFSKESLDKLKAKANSEGNTHKISTLQAVLGHLARSTVRSGWVSESSGEAVIMMAIGARARMGLGDTYFGNAFCDAALAIGAAEILHNGLGYAALKINGLVSEQTNEKIIGRAEQKVVYNTVGKWTDGPLIIASSPRHDVYGNDFGWGKPIAVRSGIAQRFKGLVIVFPAAETGGIDLEVCLPEETLQAMEDDAEFMGAFTTSTKLLPSK